MPPPLAATLRLLAPKLSALRHDWWLVGSAAMTLLGVDGLEVGDVDVLAHPDDARALLDILGAAWAAGEKSGRFRSEVFGRWLGAPLIVEVLGGLCVHSRGRWVRLQPATRQPIDHGGARFWTPSIAEMIEICELFDRDKDHARAERLRALLADS